MFFNKFVFQKRHRKETYNLGMEKEKLKFFFLEFFCKSWAPAICSTSFAFVEKSLKIQEKLVHFFFQTFEKFSAKPCSESTEWRFATYTYKDLAIG